MTLSTAQGLALIRAAFGLYFVVSALGKTTSGWLASGEGLAQFVGRNLEGAPSVYAGFLDSIVLPNATTFAQLVVLGEWVAGLSLLVGLFTRLGALVGAWLVLNYMIAKGWLDAAGSTDRLFFVACLAFGLAAAGLVWGLDGALLPVLRANPVTRWLSGISKPTSRRIDDLTERRGEERRAA